MGKNWPKLVKKANMSKRGENVRIKFEHMGYKVSIIGNRWQLMQKNWLKSVKNGLYVANIGKIWVKDI